MCAKNLTIKLLILINLLNAIKCANILAVFPIPFKEHQVIYRPLLEKLANYGHNILLLTTDPIDFNKVGNQSIERNIEQIDLGFVYDLEVLDKLQNSNLDGTKMLKNVFGVMRSLSEAELQNPNVQKLIRNHQNYKFDAVIAEWSGVSIMNAFAYKFNVPLIGISTGGAFINSHEAFGNPNHPTAYPSIFMPFTEDLNIFQRITSVFFSIWYRYYYYTEELTLQNAIAQTYFGEELPDLWKIESQADLLLINSYQVLGNIRPVVPTTIYLGGIHQELNVKPMTTSLQAFIQDSVGPMVYVNINHDTNFRLEKVLRSLEAINANIIWNNNDGQIINTTCRIYQNYDASQETILNSKHVDVFITDGGQHNIEDAIHNRVPVLGISYSTTLEHYLRQIEKHEAGLISFIDFETQTTLTDKIRKALQKEIYQANMNELSRLVLDQPMTSVDRAIWWIEYVIRNNGTRHLQAPKLPWFQYLLLDVGLAVVFVWSIILCAISFIIYRLVRYSKSLPFEMVTRGSKKAKVL